MRSLKVASILVAALLLPATVHAKDMSDQLGKAEELLQSGQPKAAYEALDEVVEDFWKRSPMFVRKATFATDIVGYGLYKEHAAIFKDDEPQEIYVEPIGYAYGTDEAGQYSASWGVDYVLTNPDGVALYQKEDFLELGLPLGQRNREIHLTLTVNLTGLKPGKYVSHYHLKDRNSEKTADFSLPFEIVN